MRIYIHCIVILHTIYNTAVTHVPGLNLSVLNLGLSDSVVKAIAETTNNFRWAYDSYRKVTSFL